MENGTNAMLHPYLAFDGNCREAMTFYHGIFGGDIYFMTFGEAPMEGMAEENKDRIMHASLTSGNLVLMASDSMPGMSPEIVNGTAVSLSIASKDLAESKEIFQNLSDGGTVTMPFEPAFWGATFGMLTDKFGMHWMVNCEMQEEKTEAA